MTITRYLLSHTAGGPANYWYAIASFSGANVYGMRVAHDSSRNIYAGFTQYISGTYDHPLNIILNRYGAVQSQTEITGQWNLLGVAATSAGLTCLAIGTDTYVDGGLWVFDSGNQYQWSEDVSYILGGSFRYECVAFDASSNIYAGGDAVNNSSVGVALIRKFNSTGTLQWQRQLTGGTYPHIYGICTDSSSNVIVVGDDYTSSGMIAKYSSAGSLTWQRKLTLSGAQPTLYGVKADSSANLYAIAYRYSSPNSTQTIIKYNSSGVLQWQRDYTYTNSEVVTDIALDSSANVYVLMSNTSTLILVKYNTSGTIQWSREISAVSGSSVQSGGISIDAGNDICIIATLFGTPSGYPQGVILKVPSDGTKTGTYTDIAYTAITGTDSAGSLTDAAGTQTSATLPAPDGSSASISYTTGSVSVTATGI